MWNEKKGLIVGLVILLMIIIGLIVGVLVMNRNGEEQKQYGEEEINFVLPEELMTDSLSQEDQVIKETSLMMQDSNSSEEDIENYYDEVIGGALSNNDTELAIRIIIQKMNFLAVVKDNCAGARAYIDGVDLSYYSTEELEYLSSYVVSMAGECGDLGLGDRWNFYVKGSDS